MVKLNKTSVFLFLVAQVTIVYGLYLVHPAIALIVAGIFIAGMGVLNLDQEG